MRSPTAALLWEIWQKHRWTIAVIAALTAAGHLVHFLDAAGRAQDVMPESSPLPTLLAMFAFLLLLGAFNYTESTGHRGLGRFPQRLFVLPVTSLRLVAVPTVAGIAAIEVLYLMWREPLSANGTANLPFVGVLLASLVVFYLWALWALARTGSLRLFALGAIIVGLFAVGMLPGFEPTPPPFWRSEIGLAAIVAVLALIAFLHAWHHVAAQRIGGAGDRSGANWVEHPFQWIANATPRRQKPFATAAAAHFWFEWRASGTVLPVLVGGVLCLGIIPVSWHARFEADATLRLVLGALASPIVLSIPVGIAFSKPTFWSEDLAVPAFVAIRPLSSEDLVATKLKVAALSVLLSWAVVLAVLTVWLGTLGKLASSSRLAAQPFASLGYSTAAGCGIFGLFMLAGMILTWRSLVSRLWSGLSGIRRLLVGSVVSLAVLVLAGLVTEAGRLSGWLFADAARFEPFAKIAAALVTAKFALAAYAWRNVSPQNRRNYSLIWLAATSILIVLGIVVWRTMRVGGSPDLDPMRNTFILLALLAVPLARVWLAPVSLARNRHR